MNCQPVNCAHRPASEFHDDTRFTEEPSKAVFQATSALHLKGDHQSSHRGGSTPVLVALLAYRRPVDHGAKQTWRRALNSLSARRFRQVGRSACYALGRRTKL